MEAQEFLQNLSPWLLSHGIKIVIILGSAFLTNWFLKIFIERMVKKIVGKKMEKIAQKRAKTLISIFGGTGKFVIGFIALLMILPELGINIGALLTTAGLIGLAVGMASKEIISDFLAGLFIILEDQYQVGDKVKIAGINGEVKEITLRKTVVKDETGLIHFIPNGQIKIVAKKIDKEK